MPILLIKIKGFATLVLALCIIVFALLFLRHVTEDITLSMVINAAKATPARYILLSMFATFVSFSAIAINEVIAVKTLPNHNLAWFVPVLAGTTGNALSNTLGFHALTLSAWRYKVYTRAGLNLSNIVRITGVSFLGIILGFAGVTAFCLIFDPAVQWVSFLLGILLLLLITGFLTWAAQNHQQISFKSEQVALPKGRFGLLQFIVGFIDLSAAIYASYILLPADISPSFAHFALFYIAAVLFGIASHAPGGIGIFEAGMMTALATEGRADVLAALLLYRVIYNLLPFCCACITVAAHTLKKRTLNWTRGSV